MVAEAPMQSSPGSCGGWAEQFETFAQTNEGPLQEVRAAAFQRFVELGFPTPKNEEWKYTNVAPIARTTFALAQKGSNPGLPLLARYGLLNTKGPRMVFSNGVFDQELSNVSMLPDGVRVGSIAELLRQEASNPDRALLDAHLAKHASYEEQAFVALNTAFLNDGIYLFVDANVVCDEPVQVFHVSSSEEGEEVSHMRLLVHAAENSSVTFSESYFGLDEKNYFTSAVAEIVLEEGATVVHHKLQFEAEEAYHVSTTEIVQAGRSNYANHSFSFGGGLVRNDINPSLDGEEIETTLNGLSVLRNDQHVDNHTVIDHLKPNCLSNEWYKGIYADSSRGVFNGTIIVRKDAQKTNAIQSNQALLLSRDATIDSKPQLKIWADDVRCTHGATFGQLDEEALFYLRSRGIGVDEARALLIHGFAADVLSQVETTPLREFLEGCLFDKLKTVDCTF